MAWTPPAVGQRGTWTRTFTAEDVERYALITGDRNPLHFDPDFAARTRPGRLIVHGGLTTGLFNALVAEVLPGPGSVFLHQEWDYPAPVYIGDTVTAEAEVIEARAGQADHHAALRRPPSRRHRGAPRDVRRLHPPTDRPDVSRAIENEPAARWPQLTILGFGMVLAMSPSFAAAAVAPILREEWTVGTLELPFLTVVVQLGFAVGALGLAVIGAPDVISGPKLFAAGALVAAAANLGFGLFANDPASAVPFRFLTGHGPGRRLSRRDEAGRRLVPSRPRTGHRAWSTAP